MSGVAVLSPVRVAEPHRAIPAPLGSPQMLATPAERNAFAVKPLVRAIRLTGQQGRRDEQALFVRALSEQLDSDKSRVLATELATSLNRQDLAVWTARSSRNSTLSVSRLGTMTLPYSENRRRTWR